MDFLSFYPKGKNLFVEIVPDKYIQWQPNTEEEIPKKITELTPLINQLRSYCLQKSIKQIVLIDCDKAVQFDKLNYVLTCKLVSKLVEIFPDPKDTLSRVEMHHCNSAIVGIYSAAKGLLPRTISDIYHLYTT
jgi:hypothetical protein